MGRRHGGARRLLLALFAASLIAASDSINGGDGDGSEQVRRISSICKLSMLDIAAASIQPCVRLVSLFAMRADLCRVPGAPAQL